MAMLKPTLDCVGDDPRIWLEEVEAEDCLAWVRSINAQATQTLGEPSESDTYKRILAILDSKDKIPSVGRVLNGLYYNFWQDDVHVKGIWRRCTLDEYRKPAPAWEEVLDLDALSAKEGVTWVWKGSTVLDEGAGVPAERVLLKLSRGGSDAVEVREFDLNSKRFLPAADGGFFVPEAKTFVTYKDRDTLHIGTDMTPFGVDGSLTDSGYPRTAYEWKRGTPLSAASLLFEGKKEDVLVVTMHHRERAFWHSMRERAITFYTSEYFAANEAGDFVQVPVQEDAKLDTFVDQYIIELRSDWAVGGRTFPAGSLLATAALPFLSGDVSGLVALFTPTETASLQDKCDTYNYLILECLDDVRSELRFWRYTHPAAGAKGTWALERSFKGEGIGSLSVGSSNANESDEIWLTTTSYTQPTAYELATAEAPEKKERIKALPSFYDASGLTTEQRFATSKDGTRVPYFLIRKSDKALDGSTPTLLYGYGGFEISLTPSYIATVGVGWLERGGAYVQANIRGGGEYGPRWHQAALKASRNKAYEDFEAVAVDLVKLGVTSHDILACEGGSNGGLLVGNMLTRSPQLWGAIVCAVPLLDMRRFSKLLAGASWMGEYGDPDKEDEWASLQNYSPYHQLKANTTYPPVLFTTSTRDDRVHPGHARKMVHKLLECGMASALYYENIEGGHGGAADNKQRAFMKTLSYSFLQRALVDKEIQPCATGACSS